MISFSFVNSYAEQVFVIRFVFSSFLSPVKRGVRVKSSRTGRGGVKKIKVGGVGQKILELGGFRRYF